MSDTVRKPQQRRSIDKRNKIIRAGYELFAKNGYFNTNTAEIAKKAGVSTGLVYGYFRDKRDILVEAMEIYIEKAYRPIFDVLDNMSAPLKLDSAVSSIVDEAITVHKNNAAMHEALHALSHTDEMVNKKFIELEDEMTKKFAERLRSFGGNSENLCERVHLSMNMVESYAHEYVYDKHGYIDYGEMKKIVIKLLIELFS